MPAPHVRGVGLDPQTRCAHYHSPLDIVAVKMKCCATYFACKECHAALADHALEPWPSERRDAHAVLCGACGCELTIAQYLASEDCCPVCSAGFNPGCREHRGFYFSADSARG